MINRAIYALVIAILATLPICSLAQVPMTVGTLLDKGGKKLSKNELTEVITDATVTGPAPSVRGWNATHTYKADGSLSGMANMISGSRSTRLIGKWWLNDQGQMCTDVTNGFDQNFKRCDYYFRAGSAYYMAPTDDTSADLVERKISR